MEDKTAERQELSVGPLFSEDALQRLRDELSFRMMMDPLIAACDAALDWADANARAFPIETAPKKGGFLAWGSIEKEWVSMGSWSEFVEYGDDSYTLWTPLPPPPSNPPLPAPLEALGEVLRRVKGCE